MLNTHWQTAAIRIAKKIRKGAPINMPNTIETVIVSPRESVGCAVGGTGKLASISAVEVCGLIQFIY